MKKVILSSIVAAAIATSASAGMKVGMGVDMLTTISNPVATAGTFGASIGSTPVVRIPVDLDGGIRVEPRIAYATATNDFTGADVATTLTVMGIGGYYNLSETLSVGGMYDMYTVTSDSAAAEATGTSMGVVLKAEVAVGKNFTVASELGFASTTTTMTANDAAETTLAPVTSVTFRYFF